MIAAAAPAAAAATRSAWAGGQTQPVAGNGNALVPGSAPLPEFHLDFILDDPAGHSLAAPGTGNLEIALTSPDSGVFRFLFSPRPQFGFNLDPTTGNRGYAGLTWNLFDGNHLFGNFGLAGSYADPGAPNDPLHRPLGPPIMLHRTRLSHRHAAQPVAVARPGPRARRRFGRRDQRQSPPALRPAFLTTKTPHPLAGEGCRVKFRRRNGNGSPGILPCS
jgi:hypothetical protein